MAGSSDELGEGLFSGSAFAAMLLHIFGEDLSVETEGLTIQEAYFDTGLKINHLTVEQVAIGALWVSGPFARICVFSCVTRR